MPLVLDPALDLVVRAALAVLWASAAWHKLHDRAGFRASLDAYGLLPRSYTPVVATLLPIVEGALAVGLWLPVTKAAAVVGSTTVLGVYALAMAQNLRRGRRDLDCGCGGTSRPVSWWLVARNLATGAAGLAAVATVGDRPLVWVDGLTVIAGTLALAATWLAIDELLAVEPHRAALQEFG
jgi:Methylamine utilisation protein MauE